VDVVAFPGSVDFFSPSTGDAMSNSGTLGRRDLPPRPLTVIRRSFGQLADRPVTGLPPGWDGMRAGVLARCLLYPQIPAGQVDAVWAELIRQARTGQETAVLVCAGIALPMLNSVTAKLCGLWFDRADTESMVVLAFLDAVAEVDLERPSVANRLRWATFHRTCPPVRERKDAPIPVRWLWLSDGGPVPGKDDVVSSPPSGHPDVLLALAVDEGVISAAEAGLITDTRLHQRRLDEIAGEAGIPYATLAKRRRRAERRLAPWLRQRIADTRASTEVEIAALDHLTGQHGHPVRRRSAARLSKTQPIPGVPPAAEPAHDADPTTRQEDPRCA
jgi:hypothetical protein